MEKDAGTTPDQCTSSKNAAEGGDVQSNDSVQPETAETEGQSQGLSWEQLDAGRKSRSKASIPIVPILPTIDKPQNP